MADTQRSKAALAALFGDNTSQQISPQDLRDFLESASNTYGSMYISAATSTTVATSGTYVKALGTTTSVNLNRVTMPANNRLTYTGTPDVHAHIALSVSFSTSGTNQTLGLAVAKNGSILTHSEIRNKSGAAGDLLSTALHADAMLSTNDYLEIFVTNHSGTTSLKVDYGYLFFMGMLV